MRNIICCVIVPSFYPAFIYGGPIYSVYMACKHIAKRGLRINVGTTNANGATKLEVDTNNMLKLSDNLFVHYYNETIIGRFSIPFILGVRNEIKNADVVHIHAIFSVQTPIALFISKLKKKPILLSPRGALSTWALKERKLIKFLWLKFLIKPLIKNIYWHATSRKEKHEIIQQFPSASVQILPNGIEINHYKQKNILKQDYILEFTGKRVNKVDNIIISMGRIHKVKAFDLLILAFKDILKDSPNSYLLIAGQDDGDQQRLEKMVKELSLSNYVYFTGYLEGDDKSLFLENADIFVLSSFSENFSNVVLEALACGVPVVASKGTPWKIIEEFECGCWVDNDPKSLTAAINKILNNSSDIDLSNNAKKLASQYSWDNISQQFIEVYRKVIKYKSI